MSDKVEVPSLDDLIQSAFEVPAFYGDWACPVCKTISWYNSVPHPRVLALQRGDMAKLRFRLNEHTAMLECFQQEIQAHLKGHEEVTNA